MSLFKQACSFICYPFVYLTRTRGQLCVRLKNMRMRKAQSLPPGADNLTWGDRQLTVTVQGITAVVQTAGKPTEAQGRTEGGQLTREGQEGGQRRPPKGFLKGRWVRGRSLGRTSQRQETAFVKAWRQRHWCCVEGREWRRSYRGRKGVRVRSHRGWMSR